jgi:hypothetical protein
MVCLSYLDVSLAARPICATLYAVCAAGCLKPKSFLDARWRKLTQRRSVTRRRLISSQPLSGTLVAARNPLRSDANIDAA